MCDDLGNVQEERFWGGRVAIVFFFFFMVMSLIRSKSYIENGIV